MAAPAVPAIPFHTAGVLRPRWVERVFKLDLLLFEWQGVAVYHGDVDAGIFVLAAVPLVDGDAVDQAVVFDHARQSEAI